MPCNWQPTAITLNKLFVITGDAMFCSWKSDIFQTWACYCGLFLEKVMYMICPIQQSDTIWLCKLQKRCTRLAAASIKVYQLLAHGPWFSLGNPASSTTKTCCHDIAESGIETPKINQSIRHHFQICHIFILSCCLLLCDYFFFFAKWSFIDRKFRQ